MRKIAISLSLIIVITLISFYVYINELKSYSTTSVLESAWDKFDIVSYQIGITDPTIWIGIEGSDEKELQQYLKQNLSQSDQNRYDIEIFQNEQ